MEKEKTISIRTGQLIALCYIFDDFDKFNSDLVKLKSSKHNKDIIDDLRSNSRKKRKFYQENKSTIDIINKYSSSLIMFIQSNYDYKGKLRNDSSLAFFYQYILSHKDKLQQIINLLERIDELGFHKLEFNENLDFANTEYKVNTNFYENLNITYLDNIQVIPNYENDVVVYGTTDSNYIINLNRFIKELAKYNGRIIVNSLLFDKERLPENITKESIFDEIIMLKGEQKEKCNTIRDLVDLSVNIDDLNAQFNSFNRVIERLCDGKSKNELCELALKIKENLDKLQMISDEYEDSLSKEESYVTKEKLQKEKQAYLKRRNCIDLD